MILASTVLPVPQQAGESECAPSQPKMNIICMHCNCHNPISSDTIYFL